MSDRLASSGLGSEWEEASFTLGDNLIDPIEGTLTTEAGTTRLNNKSLRVLLCLAARAPRLVGREELLREVWGEVFVGEAVLTTAIWELRSKLQQAAGGALIETVRGKGYRLRSTPSPAPSAVGVAPQRPAARSRAVARWAALAAMVLAVGVVVATLGGRGAELSPRQGARAVPDRENGRFARSLVEVLGRGGLEEVAAGIERAVAENPESMAARLRLAQIRALQGRWEEGRSEVERAYERIPGRHAFSWKQRVVRTLHILRAFERVEELTADESWFRGQRAGQVDDVLIYRAYALSRLGRREEAASIVCRLSWRNHPQRAGDLGYLLATLGSEDCAEDLLSRVLESAEGELNLAKIYLGMGKDELALKLLEELAERRGAKLVWIALDPALDRLADEPRFKALLDGTSR